jgi:minor extracellular serine protease Vpr
MIRGILLACLMGSTIYAGAQTAKLSPQTRIFLNETATNPTGIPEGYVWVKDAAGKTLIKAFLQIDQAQAAAVSNQLKTLGVNVGTKAGAVWTAAIPAEKLQALTNIPGINYLQLDEPVHPTMDAARKSTRVDSVHAGYGLPMAYSGKDVVVGIIDAGFDYGHPSLFDTTGVGYRVRKVWEQKNSAGTPPATYGYGHEMTDSTDMWTKGTDLGISHGAHVTGIAAGSGFGGDPTNRLLRGMAYKSDLVFVGITPEPGEWLSTGMTDIIDGISYIYEYAASVSKPAIANLSWGCSMGPHDGSSLFSKACDALTGPGKLFSVSAGNNGEEKIHLKKTFSNTDTLLNSFVTFDAALGEKKAWLDIWSDTAKSFCASITLYQGSTQVNTTGFICLDDALHQEYLIGSDNDTLFINIATELSSFNSKPRILMQFYSKTIDMINLTVKASDGTVQAWNGYVKNTTGYYGAFFNGGFPAWAVGGNEVTTIGDMAATRSAISVAAYTSRSFFTNLAGGTVNYSTYTSVGQRVPFSSHGPLANGAYMKPDITGPGMTLGSAVNSYDPSMVPGGGSEDNLIKHYLNPANNRDYYYAQLSGTSMSSPAVAGILALMLQADPTLNPDAARSILRQTAIKDNNTTQSPDSTLWGAGKVNGYKAVMMAAGVSGITNTRKQSLLFNLYPNPAQKQFTVACNQPSGTLVQLTILNMAGIPVWVDSWTTRTLDERKEITPALSAGTYLVRLKAGNKEGTEKLVIY